MSTTRNQRIALARAQRHVTMIYRSVTIRNKRDKYKAMLKCWSGAGLKRRKR